MDPLEDAVEYSDRSIGYDALANSRRRRLLRVLDAAGSPQPLDELAAELAHRTEGKSGVTDEERIEQIRTSLYHVHVPKLAEAGFVRYDEDDGRVTLTSSAPLEAIEALEG